MKKTIKSVFDSFKFSFSMAWAASKMMTIIRMLLIIIEAVIPVLISWLGKLIVDLLTNGVITNSFHRNRIELLILLLILVVLGFSSVILRKVRDNIESMHIDLINFQIDKGIMEKSARLDLSYFDNPKLYNEINIVSRDKAFLQKLIWNTSSLIQAIVSLVSSLILLIGLHWSCSLIVAVLCFPDAIIDQKLRKRIYNNSNEMMLDERRFKYLYKLFFEKESCKEMRLYHLKDYLIDKYIHIRENWHNERMKFVKKRGEIRTFTSMISAAGFICIEIFAGIKVIMGRMTLGNYTFYTGLFSNAISSMDTLIRSVLNICDADMRVRHHLNFMGLKENVYPCGEGKIVGVPTIEFCNVSFKYPNTDMYVLKNVSFKIKPCEKVAIVGLNGAGKTTLTKLLMRFYEPTSGQILLNNRDIHEYSESEIKQLYSAVFQDFAKYSLTVRETVAMSDINALNDTERLKDACKKSGASDFVEKWENGYDTYLTKRFNSDGEELSGGQWQKIVLASAFFRDSRVLVLDEPTASLDPKAEYEIFEQFTSLIRDKSAILISHRLSSVVMVDKIIVLKDHEIAEIGSHQELMTLDGVYAKLFKMQAQKYMDK